MATDRSVTGPKIHTRLPRAILALGFVSMFMDISSEMIHALLPVYLVTVLGTSTLAVGFIEGIAEATANITKIFSGALSDWLGKRKMLTTIDYGLAAFTKPIFPLATTIGWVVAARFIDRIGLRRAGRAAGRDAESRGAPGSWRRGRPRQQEPSPAAGRQPSHPRAHEQRHAVALGC